MHFLNTEYLLERLCFSYCRKVKHLYYNTPHWFQSGVFLFFCTIETKQSFENVIGTLQYLANQTLLLISVKIISFD